ncbi:DUF5714 domain-containing protein [Ruminococcaceae bacterium OttesenSCG-928-N02]|nr:DUF5714 domain-containing protein [Ruminococcaceae bacterium OttesenSCG-928-N02]
MPHKIQLKCLVCEKDQTLFGEAIKTCDLCGAEFEANFTCSDGHYVCHTCRQKDARESMITHCLESEHKQPYPLMIELMCLPKVAMHGPEHHLLLTAALLTAYCNEKGERAQLPAYLVQANERSMGVPGGACGLWGICGAAVGSGIYVSILTKANPYAQAQWKTAGQMTTRCANAVSREGGPRCCKRDSFLSLLEAIEYSNEMLHTHYTAPDDLRCDFYPNNTECKQLACPFFPASNR